MKDKLIYTSIIVITILAQLIIPNNVRAMGENEQININIAEEGIAPYTYSELGETNYKILKNGDNYIYTLFDNVEQIDTSVNNNSLYQDENVKAIIRNGYPFKTLSELGCSSIKEAYLATQEAIITYLENRDVQLYNSTTESGTRIINAISKILENVAKEIQDVEDKEIKAGIQLKAITGWVNNIFYPGYITKKYKIKPNLEMVTSSLSLEGIDGGRIVDVNSNDKNTFTQEEDTFLVLIPEETIQNFRLIIKSEQLENQMYVSNNTNTPEKQYVVLEKNKVETETIIPLRNGDVSTIKIVNVDDKTNTVIQGNTFELVDENLENQIAQMTTNENGEIRIPDVKKGKYYIRQTGTTDDYKLSKALIEINIDGSSEEIQVEIRSSVEKIQETLLRDEKIVLKEETTTVVDKNVTDVTNITSTNINHDVINETNETNLNDINYFNNTTNRKNILNLKRTNTYNTEVNETNTKNSMLSGENKMTRQDIINYIDLATIDNIQVPILPVASR